MFAIGKQEQLDNQNHIGLVIQESEFHLVCINISQDNTIKVVKEYTGNFTTNDEFKKKLSSYIYRNDLINAPCNWVLTPKDYKLLVLDTPPVPEEEQMQALKWQALEKADASESELLIDIMKLPIKSDQEVSGKAYAVIAKKEQIIQTASLIESSRLDLSIIDISENALTQLVGTTKYHDKSVAFIIKILGNLTLLVCKKNQLFLTRKLSLVWHSETSEDIKDEQGSADDNATDGEEKIKNDDGIIEDKQKLSMKETKSSGGLSILRDDVAKPIKQLNITQGSVKNLDDLEEEKTNKQEEQDPPSHAVELLVNEVRRSFEYCNNNLFLEEPEYILYANVPEIQNFVKEFSELVNQHVVEFNMIDFIEYVDINEDELNLVALGGALRYRL